MWQEEGWMMSFSQDALLLTGCMFRTYLIIADEYEVWNASMKTFSLVSMK